ncbi:MAG: hypothetical protein J7507_02830 [Pseudoxanthomonas sp.]|nr:hypothetical protein [Pseudoxanthomonas sp.]
MNRRLLWGAALAAVAFTAAVPLLAQNRQADKGQDDAALAEHKAQERQEKDQAAERAKRREAARAGQDARQKGQPQREEEEEKKGEPR